MSGPFVSVLIPAYNSEDTLAAAVESCLDDTAAREIIIVDDCSTDSTGSIADSLAGRNPGRVRVIHHSENMQLLEARRTGVNAATQKYVTFLDADDTLSPGYCSSALAAIEETGSDILALPIEITYKPGDTPTKDEKRNRAASFKLIDSVKHDEDIVHFVFSPNRGVSWNVCSKLYRRELLEKSYNLIPSQRLFMGEDAYINFVAMTQAHLMVSNSELPSYRYDASGETSTSRKYSAIKFHTICQGSLVWKGIGQYLQSQGISEKYKGDLEWLRFCILGDAANRYPNLVTDGEQPAAFDALLEQWPLHSAVAALALFHWNSAPQTLRPALESRTASSLTHPGNRLSIALFPSARKDTECCLALAAAVDSWASLGAQITLFGESAPSSLTKNHSIDIVTLPMYDCGDFFSLERRMGAFRETLLKKKVNVFIADPYYDPVFPWDLLIARCLGLRCIIWDRHSFLFPIGELRADLLQNQLCFPLANAVICSCEEDATYWQAHSASAFVEPAVNYVRAPFKVTKSISKKKAPSVVWEGPISTNPGEGLLDAIHAMGPLVDRYPESQLHLVGDCSGERAQNALAVARSLGVDRSLVFEGDLDESGLFALLCESSVYLATSRFHAASLSLGLALSAHVPCIAYEYPQLSLCKTRANTTEGVVVVPDGNASELGNQLLRLIELDTLEPPLHNSGERHPVTMDEDDGRFWKDIMLATQQILPQTRSKTLYRAMDMRVDLERARISEFRTLLDDCSSLCEENSALRTSVVEYERRLNEAESAFKQRAEEKDARISKLEHACAGFERSVSFRLGRAITAPGRAIKMLVAAMRRMKS